MGSLSLLMTDPGWAVHLMLETMTPIVQGLKSTKAHKEPRHILSLKGWFGYWLMYRPPWLGTPLIRRKISYLFVCLNNSLSPTQHPTQSMFAKANAAAAFGSTLHRGGQRRIRTNQLQLGGNSSSSRGKPAPRLAWLALTDTDNLQQLQRKAAGCSVWLFSSQASDWLQVLQLSASKARTYAKKNTKLNLSLALGYLKDFWRILLNQAAFWSLLPLSPLFPAPTKMLKIR